LEKARQVMRDLLILLLEAVSDEETDLWDEHGRFRAIMRAAGYDETIIADLLAWFEGQWQSDVRRDPLRPPPAASLSGQGVRLQTEEERACLTPEAFGRLLGLVHAGQISRAQMERLLHVASLTSPSPLDRSGVEDLVDQVVFLRSGPLHAYLLPDSWGRVH
jgi:uncharacterized protein Smg (DUF494 family)